MTTDALLLRHYVLPRGTEDTGKVVARDEAQGCQVGWAMRIGTERERESGKVGGEESRSAGGTRTGLPRGMVHEGGNRVAMKDGASG